MLVSNLAVLLASSAIVFASFAAALTPRHHRMNLAINKPIIRMIMREGSGLV